MRRWKQQEIPCLENDDGQFRLAKCCSMLPTNRATMQEYQSSGIILCLHITGASKASISGVQLVTREDARRKGWKTSPCISLSCPKINLCLVSKTFNISDATWLMRRRLGRHEGHVKISVFVVQTPCHDGISCSSFPHQPSSSSSTTTHLFPVFTMAPKQHEDGFLEALDILMMSLGYLEPPLFWFCLVRRLCSEASSSPLTTNSIFASKNCLQSR